VLDEQVRRHVLARRSREGAESARHRTNVARDAAGVALIVGLTERLALNVALRDDLMKRFQAVIY
jgi:hypothetical protein